MRSYRSVRRVAIASVLVLVASVALTSGIAADPPVDHCTVGEVTSAFEAWAPGFMLNDRLGLDHAGLAEGVGLCQYRMFYDGATACFCEDDIFLGGTTWYTLVDPPNGLSPSEASEWFNQLVVQVELDGSAIDVVGTAVKGAVHPSYGQLFWQQHGVFFQLPPGDYLSTYRDCHPDFGSCDPGGDGWWESNVLVRVLPHDVAHELGPAEYPGFGSVQCPED